MTQPASSIFRVFRTNREAGVPGRFETAAIPVSTMASLHFFYRFGDSGNLQEVLVRA